MLEVLKGMPAAFALIGILIIVVAGLVKYITNGEQRKIQSAPEGSRAQLVAQALNKYDIDSRNLTKEQRYNLALKQIKAHSTQAAWKSLVAAFFAALLVVLIAYVVNRTTDFFTDRSSGNSSVKPSNSGFSSRTTTSTRSQVATLADRFAIRKWADEFDDELERDLKGLVPLGYSGPYGDGSSARCAAKKQGIYYVLGLPKWSLAYRVTEAQPEKSVEELREMVAEHAVEKIQDYYQMVTRGLAEGCFLRRAGDGSLVSR